MGVRDGGDGGIGGGGGGGVVRVEAFNEARWGACCCAGKDRRNCCVQWYCAGQSARVRCQEAGLSWACFQRGLPPRWKHVYKEALEAYLYLFRLVPQAIILSSNPIALMNRLKSCHLNLIFLLMLIQEVVL